MRRISVSADEDFVDEVDARRASTTSRAEAFRRGGRQWCITRDKEDSFDGDLPDGWWEDAQEFYLKYLREQQAESEPEPAEAD